MHQVNLNLIQMSIYVKSHDICKFFIKKHDNMNYDVMIYALKVVRNHEFSGQVCTLSVSMVRAMLQAKDLPRELWGEAVNTVFYILNRASSKAL